MSCFATRRDVMDVSDPAPRVNFELMAKHMNKKVKLVGEVGQAMATATAC